MFRLGLSQDKKTFTAQKFEGFKEETCSSLLGPDEKFAIVLDTETTGLDRAQDEIIEIACRKISFHPESGAIRNLGESFSALQEPKKELPAEITRITGLSKEDLKGKSIDWSSFERFIEDAVLIIAHNASFDRPFVDRYSELSQNKIWACSASQVPWIKWFPSSKQEFLTLFHAFFYEAHRSLRDVDALIKLLQQESPVDEFPSYFSMLLSSARKKRYLVSADKAPYESRELLRRRHYMWLVAKKVWVKNVGEDELEEEKGWLTKEIYGAQGFFGGVRAIPAKDNFKVIG